MTSSDQSRRCEHGWIRRRIAPAATGSGNTIAVHLWSLPALLLVIATTVVPVAMLARDTVTSSTTWSTLLRRPVVEALRFSIWQAAWSTGLTLLFGSILAWILARYEFRGRTFTKVVLTIPFVLPTVVVGAAFIAVLPSSFERSVGSIVLAHVFFNMSVVIRLVAPQWSILDSDMLAVARTLGTSRRRLITRIILPTAGSALKSAGALVFLLSFTSYGVVRILGGSGLNTIEVEIYRRAVLVGDVSGATVLATVQTLVIVLLFASTTRRAAIASRRIDTKREAAPRWALIAVALFTSFVLVPLVVMVVQSVRVGGHWSTSAWSNLMTSSGPLLENIDIPTVTLRSLTYALLAAMIAVPVGVAAAIGLARGSGRLTRILLVAPMATSAVVIGFGILVTYDSAPLDIRSKWWLIPIIHAVIALPFVVRSSLAVVESIPQSLRDAAAVLGASPVRRWWTVDAPLLTPALATAFGLSGALSLGEFGATSFLTRRRTQTLPTLIDQLLSKAGDSAFTTAMATGTILLVLTSLIVIAFDTTLRT